MRSEGPLLYRLAQRCSGRGVIVEIGSWKGKSTIWLAAGSQAGANSSVYAIDHHTGSAEHRSKFGKIWTFDEFQSNIEKSGFNAVVKPIVKTSVEAARVFDRPIELLFIDGGHDYASVMQDFQSWYPKVVEGGVIAFHDAVNCIDVTSAVDEVVFRARLLRSAWLRDSILYAVKGRRDSSYERLRALFVRTQLHFLAFIIRSWTVAGKWLPLPGMSR